MFFSAQPLLFTCSWQKTMHHAHLCMHMRYCVPVLLAMQVLVPVALMQPDQGTVGGQAYMLVNRDDFPAMMACQGVVMPPGQAQASGDEHKQADVNEGLMDVLVGAANRVEGEQEGGRDADDGADGDEGIDEESKAVEKQPLITRSGRKRNPSRSF
jgi:hypothetical protein